MFLGAFEELRKAFVSFVVSVRVSARNHSAPHWAGFNEIWYLCIFPNSGKEFQVSLKSDKNKGCFTWRPTYMYEGVSEISRTGAIAKYTYPNKRVWKLPTSTQLRATWHNDSLDMVVPSTGASRHHNCCIDGGTNPEYYGCSTLEHVWQHLTHFFLEWEMFQTKSYRK
jgi:hypothetical protein